MFWLLLVVAAVSRESRSTASVTVADPAGSTPDVAKTTPGARCKLIQACNGCVEHPYCGWSKSEGKCADRNRETQVLLFSTCTDQQEALKVAMTGEDALLVDTPDAPRISPTPPPYDVADPNIYTNKAIVLGCANPPCPRLMFEQAPGSPMAARQGYSGGCGCSVCPCPITVCGCSTCPCGVPRAGSFAVPAYSAPPPRQISAVAMNTCMWPPCGPPQNLAPSNGGFCTVAPCSCGRPPCPYGPSPRMLGGFATADAVGECGCSVCPCQAPRPRPCSPPCMELPIIEAPPPRQVRPMMQPDVVIDHHPAVSMDVPRPRRLRRSKHFPKRKTEARGHYFAPSWTEDSNHQTAKTGLQQHRNHENGSGDGSSSDDDENSSDEAPRQNRPEANGLAPETRKSALSALDDLANAVKSLRSKMSAIDDIEATPPKTTTVESLPSVAAQIQQQQEHQDLTGSATERDSVSRQHRYRHNRFHHHHHHHHYHHHHHQNHPQYQNDDGNESEEGLGGRHEDRSYPREPGEQGDQFSQDQQEDHALKNRDPTVLGAVRGALSPRQQMAPKGEPEMIDRIVPPGRYPGQETQSLAIHAYRSEHKDPGVLPAQEGDMAFTKESQFGELGRMGDRIMAGTPVPHPLPKGVVQE